MTLELKVPPAAVFLVMVAAMWGAAALALVPVFVAYLTRFQVLPEERALLANFGARYADYMTRVRRWL